MYREREEKNHSPPQVEVSPVPVTARAWPGSDRSTRDSWIEPSKPVRSCALHPCVGGSGNVLCALAACPRRVPPLPPSQCPPVRPALLHLRLLNPETHAQPLHCVRVGGTITTRVGLLRRPAMRLTPDPPSCGCVLLVGLLLRASRAHKHTHAALCGVFLPATCVKRL